MIKKVLLLNVLTMLCSCNLVAQVQFQKFVIDSTNSVGLATFTPSGTYTLEASYSVDFDNDGDDDMITKLSPLRWIENTDGQGALNNEHIIDASVNSVLAIGFADIDGDNDVDIVTSEAVVNETDTVIQMVWYENLDGLGNYNSKHIISSIAGRASRIEIADLDGDDDLDVVSANRVDGNISWFENTDGLGSFNPQQEITIASTSLTTQYLEIRVGDFDNDLDNDIIFAANGSPDEKVYMLENSDGLGVFAAAQEIFDVFGGFSYIRTADLDNDGDLDFFGQNVFDGLVVAINDGTGSFTWHPSTFNTTYDEFVGFVQSIDIDNDNDVDLIGFAIDENDTNLGAIVLFENMDGLGTFSDVQIIKSVNFTRSGFRFNLADFNGDGYQDLVSFYLDGYEFSWNENLAGTGSFGPSQEIVNDLRGVRSIVSADFDTDGDIDIVFAANDHHKVGLYDNLGNLGEFDSQRILSANNFGANNVISGDIDNDGFLDLVVSSNVDNKIEWFKNDGLGSFMPQSPVSITLESVGQLMLGDLDGDTDLDIVALELVTNLMVWYDNADGQGSFSTQQIIIENIEDVEYFDIGDIDSDGDLDIIFNEPLSWLVNNGQGMFGPTQDIPSTNNGKVLLADLDGDIDLDVLTSSPLGWYENADALGNFGDFQLLDGSTLSRDNMIVMDVDDDGDLDVINTYFSGIDNEVIKLYQNYSGAFAFGVTLFETNQRISDIGSKDIDGNGSVDILYSTRSTNGSSKIAWLKNLGELNNQVSGTVIYDVNSDGCDSNDIKVPNLMVAAGNSGASFTTFTDENGDFLLEVNTGLITTLITPSLPDYFSVDPEIHFSNFQDENEIDDTANFCISSTSSVNDLNVSIYPLGNPRPGFDTSYQIIYNNLGTTLLNGEVDLQYDDAKMQYLSASEIPSTMTQGMLSFDFVNLGPFESRSITVNFNVFAPPTTNINDIISSTVTVNPVVGDNTESDNTYVLEETVIGAYDPNDILVLEGEQILLDQTDDYLHYIIRFQNTGTAEAINVRVTNIINPNLEWFTLQLEGLSHDGQMIIEDGILATFSFDNINLPSQSQDEQASNGYIAYKIKPKAGASIGDVFLNEAAIFFDFNPPIFTNRVSTEVVDALSVGDFDIEEPTVYPNPTTGLVTIRSNYTIKRITVLDVNGRQIYTLKGTNSFSLENLNKGLYFLKIDFESGTVTKKIMKQ